VYESSALDRGGVYRRQLHILPTMESSFSSFIILTMNLSGAPNSSVITVTAELSQVQRKVITKFTDKNDVAFIEIRAISVSYQLYAYMLLVCANGLHSRTMLYFERSHDLPILAVGSGLARQRYAGLE
jgi:hypothetical protein